MPATVSGIIVIDEAFDQWERAKNPQDYHLYFDTCWKKDIDAMVLRDRNHPSVVFWSIGNEINERADASGLAIAKQLRDEVKVFRRYPSRYRSHLFLLGSSRLQMGYNCRLLMLCLMWAVTITSGKNMKTIIQNIRSVL